MPGLGNPTNWKITPVRVLRASKAKQGILRGRSGA